MGKMKITKKHSNCIFLLVTLSLILALTTQPIAGQERKEVSPQPKKQVPASAKKEGASAAEKEDTSREKELRERAYLCVTNALAGANSVEDKIQAAHLRADLAGLICAYGDRAKAVEIFRQSLKDILDEDRHNNDEQKKKDKEYSKDSSSFDLALQLVDEAVKCEPDAKALITKDLENLRNSKEEKESASNLDKYSKNIQPTDTDPSIVPDELWGTQPSVRRRMGAQIFTQEAHEKIGAGKLDEAEAALRKSLNFCVTTPFVTALGRMMKDKSDVALLLFIEAANHLRALPSGAEINSLNFGLRPFGINPLSTKPSTNQRNNALVEVYLTAVTALVQSKDNMLAGSSTYTVRLVKATLPLYAGFHPEALPFIENWVKDATNKFSTTTQAMIEKSPFGSESLEDKVSRYESMASNSKDQREQDQAYASLASAMIQYGKFDKAKEWADKISETVLKREMLDGLSARQISFKLTEINEGDYSSLSLDISNISSPTLRAQLYIQLAKAVAKNELGKVETKRNLSVPYDVLQEATMLANNLRPSIAQSHLLFSIASAYAEFDSVRALTGLRDAAQSIGRHKDQPSSQLGRKVSNVTIIHYDSTGTFSRMVFDDQEEYKKPYDLSIFRKLAQVDFDIAWLSATQIEDKLLQASARYEACAAILLDRKATKGATTKIPVPQEGKNNGEKK